MDHSIGFSVSTHTGSGPIRNSDSHLAMPVGDSRVLLLVADGGLKNDAGQIATSVTADVFESGIRSDTFVNAADASEAKDALETALQHAHAELIHLATSCDQVGEICCMLSAALVSADRVDLIWVGDCRMYLYRDGVLHQLSEDQTLAWQLVKQGTLDVCRLEQHPGRHVPTQTIGMAPGDVSPQAGHASLALAKGDVVVLCTNGLSDSVDEASIARLLRESPDAGAATKALVDAAVTAGASDNVTVAIAHIPR
jgi:serine/threonine protein phosphatase PrpC